MFWDNAADLRQLECCGASNEEFTAHHKQTHIILRICMHDISIYMIAAPAELDTSVCGSGGSVLSVEVAARCKEA